MRTGFLIMLAVFALAGAVSADQVSVSISSDHGWMVANNQDSATITLAVNCTAAGNGWQPFAGANITLSVNSPWQLKDTTLVTDQNGVARTTLVATKVSGTANITVAVSALAYTDLFGWVTYSTTKTFSQPIDHGTPSSVVMYYNGQVPVRTPTPITVLVLDKWGNPVDNRNVAESVTFIASSTGISGFQSGASWTKSLAVPVNGSGYATVQYLADPLGINYVTITPPAPLTQKLISIQATSGTPFSVTSIVSPGGTPYPYTTLNTGTFTIAYTFTDQNGYPSQNQPVKIVTSDGLVMNYTTANTGMVVITYGPQSVAGNYVITATALNNPSVTTAQTVQFVSAAGTDASFTASPLTMASLDAQKDSMSTLIMKVVNAKGNPAPGESVSFSIASTKPGIFNLSAQPYLQAQYLQSVTSSTDQGGIATVQFFPGCFTTDVNNKNYSFTAVATTVVQARWGSVTRNLTLTYMNYPALSVATLVDPPTLPVGGTVNVTVRVSGDGYGLGQKPLDVVLLMDRSSSMLTNSTINGVKIGNQVGTLASTSTNDKMVDAMTAASTFVSNSGNLDRFAVLSFGDNSYYGNYAKLYNLSCPGTKCLGQQNLDAYAYQAGRDYNCDGNTWCGGSYAGDNSNSSYWYTADDVAYVNAHYYHNNVNVNTGKAYPASGVSRDTTGGMTYDKAGVISAINGIVPSGGTPTRRGIYEAVNTTITDPLIKTGNRGGTNTVKAIILLTDGGWTTGGDPEATNISPPDPDGYTYALVSLGNGVGTGSVIKFASDNGIKIFPIGLGVTPNCSATLNRYAVATGGVYYYAPDSTKLAEIYTSIAGNLRQAAGVNTTMTLSFTNIMVNNVSVTGDQVFNYTYIKGSSTRIDSWNLTQHPISPVYPYTLDSTNDWKNNRNLNFNIGTILLNQTWQATMSLQVLQAGNVNVFGAGSKIHTDTSATNLPIPDTYITVTTANSSINSSYATLRITKFTGPGGESPDQADMAWNLSYTGVHPISEDLMIAEYGTSMWNHMPMQQVSNKTPVSDTESIPIGGLPYGYYTIRLDASALDSNSDTATITIYVDASGARDLQPGEVPVPGVDAVPTHRPQIKIS